MLKTYIYCSYKFSPVGFQIGTIEYKPSTVNDYIPQEGSLDKFVVTAFEQGIVNKVYGLIPKSSKYVYLIRKLQANNIFDENEGEIDIYMNFAFEFDNFDDYKNFATNFDSLLLEENAASECAKFISPDSSIATYALKIRHIEFNSFVKKMLKPVNCDASDDKRIYVEVLASKPQENKLSEIFCGLEFSNLVDKKYCSPATTKKNTSWNSPAIQIAITTVIVITIAIFIWFRQ